MTRIRFRFREPDGLTDGGSSPRGLVVCSPTSRVVQKDESIMLPLPFVARLPEDGGDLIVSLQPTGRDWCWTIREQVGGYTHVRRVIVPDSVQTLDYATLGEASWASSATSGGLVHSMRVYSGVITSDAHVPAAELRPSDNVTVGDTCVDSTGRVWMITGLVDSDVVFGVDTGVTLGGKGERGLSFRSGMGKPSDLTQGIIGDTYIDLETGDVYQLQL